MRSWWDESGSIVLAVVPITEHEVLQFWHGKAENCRDASHGVQLLTRDVQGGEDEGLAADMLNRLAEFQAGSSSTY